LIIRRGRTGFTPSNLSEVRLRFERILARTDDKVKVPFQADAEIDEVDDDEDEVDELDAEMAAEHRARARARALRSRSATGVRRQTTTVTTTGTAAVRRE